MSYINKNNFIKAVKFIHDNIDRSFEIADIAKEVNISDSSLKRLFKEAVGQSVGSFVRKMRMEYAFSELVRQKSTIIEVALNSGFEDHSAFSRSFKQMFGYSPLEGKKKLHLVRELEAAVLEEPEIIELDEMIVQGVTKKGLYFECAPRAWTAFKEIVHPSLLEDDAMVLLVGISHDNPHEVVDDQVRFSAGVALANPIAGLEKLIVPAGSYARFRFFGKPHNLGSAYHYIYGAWRTNNLEYPIDDKRAPFLTFDVVPDGFSEQDIMINIPLILN